MFDHAFHNYLQHGFPKVNRYLVLVIVGTVPMHGT